MIIIHEVIIPRSPYWPQNTESVGQNRK